MENNAKEIAWLTVDGSEGAYLVSDSGLIKNNSTGRILNQTINHKGYARVCLKLGGRFKNKFVHRLVGFAFVDGYSEGMQINHKDGVKLNNQSTNLEWVTCSQNIKHAYESGLAKPHCNADAIMKENHGKYKGVIVATSLDGSDVIRLKGTTEIEAYGFNSRLVYQCVIGKAGQHKGYKFIREAEPSTTKLRQPEEKVND